MVVRPLRSRLGVCRINGLLCVSSLRASRLCGEHIREENSRQSRQARSVLRRGERQNAN